MKTRFYTRLLFFTLFILFVYGAQFAAYGFNITGSVIVGEGSLQIFKNGKRVLPTTELVAGDSVVVYAMPAENEALSFMMIGDDLFYSSPVLLVVSNNITVEAGFEAKRIIFKETFGKSPTYTADLGGDNNYTGFDTPTSTAVISTINGLKGNSGIHNIAQKTNDPNYSIDSIDNPHSTHVYLQVSNVAVKFAEGHELVGENIQIKFRFLPVFAGTNYLYDYSSLTVKLNNTAFTPLTYGNGVRINPFFINLENPSDAENTSLSGITAPHRAPYIVVPVPENYPNISQILISQAQQTAPFTNRGRLDDLILVADGDPNGIDDHHVVPSVYAVVTDFDIEFRGNLQSGDQISIYNLVSGAAVITKTVESDRVLIPTTNLPTGIYVASVKDSKGMINSFKVVVK
ncbi:MAG: T9SS type A sorting domain-containing protein [Paludibacter sp.]|nr:T9SS type A sorting domain-containing protein [Paludibacter sp.]